MKDDLNGGREDSFRILKVFPFTSERKAMSIVVRAPDGEIRVYVKGSDSSIKGMAIEGQDLNKFEEDVDDFARQGLRTLSFGYRVLDSNKEGTVEVEDFDDVAYDDLTVEQIEKDIYIIGSTGVEDKLHDNVEKCIQDFRAAGIKVWMLTGDKGLTAK